MKAKNLTKQINFRVSADEYETVSREAALASKTKSDVVRAIISARNLNRGYLTDAEKKEFVKLRKNLNRTQANLKRLMFDARKNNAEHDDVLKAFQDTQRDTKAIKEMISKLLKPSFAD